MADFNRPFASYGHERETTFNEDQGPRKDTSVEVLSKLRPVFSATGSVTAGNSSQMSDGAAFVMIVSENMLKKLNVEPIAKLIGYSVAGLPPKIMGMGPVRAIPKVLDQVGMKLKEIELFELNEAFASQSIAVINELKLENRIGRVNVFLYETYASLPEIRYYWNIIFLF